MVLRKISSNKKGNTIKTNSNYNLLKVYNNLKWTTLKPP